MGVESEMHNDFRWTPTRIQECSASKKINSTCNVDKVVLFPTLVHPEVANSKDAFILEMNKLNKILKGEINPIEARLDSIKVLEKLH